MFPGDIGNEVEASYLKSGRRFRSGKRRKNFTGRESCSTTRIGDYELASHSDEGSCDKEEEYQPIFKGDKELEELTETPERERGYNLPTSPHTSLEIIYRDLSSSEFVNTSSTNTVNSGKRIPSSQNFVPTV